MKIAFDYQIFSQQKYGGISRYYNNLALELSNLNQDVIIFAGLNQNNYLQSLPKAIRRGFKIAKFPPKTGRFFQNINSNLTNYQINNWRPDVVHETYYSNFNYSLNVAPRFLTVYDMVHELFNEEFGNNIITERKKIACNNADHIICISENTKNDLMEIFNIPTEKISVIYLASNIFNLSEINMEYPKPVKPFILYVGPRSGYKNFNALLEAFSQSTALMNEFDIVSFGGGGFSSNEKMSINAHGFSKGQVSQVSGDDLVLASMYKRATAFVYPSLYEGFGIPPLEAMTFGCPVISSNSSSLPEVIGGAGEYFNPNEIESLSLAIENVVFDTNRVSELKSKGFKRAKFFSWQKCAKETLSVYEKIIN